ncbi:hypothetical protein QR685DRAFT_501460 [Neurospora intermedia]|uniref:Uncharacterized protein n=1 Tax=Neurospora intermedia TaxID=5142 RepID=A0ABR3D960_NEUIN
MKSRLKSSSMSGWNRRGTGSFEYRCLSLFFLFLSPHPISLYTADLGIDANKGERAIDRVFMFFGLAIRLFDSYPTISSHLGGFASLRLC